jgi:uncharacterized protein
MMIDQNKLDRLHAGLTALGSVAVAFSAGTDSTLLLAVALQALGPERVLAITADSPTLPRSELAEAESLASELGARHRIIATEELGDPDFAQNPPDRCYYCKRELFGRMRALADAEGYAHLAYGATADDMGDYRPGMDAAREAGAVAPLLDAGLTKQDVRELSLQLGLRTWDKPAMACLSSRFPYGTPIQAEGLARVEQAEDFLRRELGLRQVRVRDGEQTARIEVPLADLPRLIEEDVRVAIIARLKALGYTFVSLNLEGLRSGSLNDALAPGVAQRGAG